jgi:hypothetical protein
MKLNRIAAGAIALGIAATVGAGTADAATATSAATPVTIKWKTVATASIVAYADYTTGATPAAGTTAGTILQGTNVVAAGGGTCGTAGSPTGNTLDFGSITPDNTVALGCLYEQGVLAKVVTNSTSWTVTQTLSAAPPAGFTVCGVPGANQTGSVTYTAPAANTVLNTCTAANTIGTTAVNFGSGAGATTGTTFLPEDINLITAANAAVTTESGLTLVLTLVAN